MFLGKSPGTEQGCSKRRDKGDPLRWNVLLIMTNISLPLPNYATFASYATHGVHSKLHNP